MLFYTHWDGYHRNVFYQIEDAHKSVFSFFGNLKTHFRPTFRIKQIFFMNNKFYSKNYFVILASCYKGCTYGLLKTGKFRGNPEFWVIETWSVKFSSLGAGNLRKKSCPKYFRNFGKYCWNVFFS